MKLHILSGGRLRMRKQVYVPEAGREETVELPVSCFLLRHSQANVLFDSGCHPTALTDPQARWGGLAKIMVPVGNPRDNPIEDLAGIGFSPADIDVVVNSHLHPDHCGCNAFFSSATMIVHAHELQSARAPAAEAKGYVRADWDHEMRTEILEGERDLFGDGRIVLLPLPGHTPGTTGALAALDRTGAVLLASDALSLRVNLDRDCVPRNTWNADLFRQSLTEIRRIENAGATVICGHDLAQWQMLRKGPDAYD
jgi:N-acyl homoserine lactone hydrolase